jgi:hypothetical protein
VFGKRKPFASGPAIGRQIVPVGLAIVALLVVVTLVASIYETVTSSTGDEAILKNPEVVAIAVGLLLSVLFVERWRSVEGRLDKLSEEEQKRLRELDEFAKTRTEQVVGETVSKAEKLSARLAAIADDNPWLEVLTKLDIVVETESVRGILRTSYRLLREHKDLHLYEYLEFCARKGTDLDDREDDKGRPRRRPLRGTAEDFLEIASFCEIWLEDYALGIEFLRRYLDGAGAAGYIMAPELIVRLLRMGRYPEVATRAAALERRLRRDDWHRRMPFMPAGDPVSERFRWKASNVLAVTYATFADERKAKHFEAAATHGTYASLFESDQALFDAEIAVNRGQFKLARTKLVTSDQSDTDAGHLHEATFMFERMNDLGYAAQLRKRLQEYRSHAYGDGPAPSVFSSRRADHNGHSPTPADLHREPEQLGNAGLGEDRHSERTHDDPSDREPGERGQDEGRGHSV